ncbi:MAG: hypothetical protein GX613_12660 [Chloroflexi bacterium]|nr:hypothetical protein [Chloroflexota bacterium]
MKRWWMLVAVALSLALAGTAFAQGDATPIAYGDTVEGEVTNAEFEVPYRFTGAAGDVVQVRMVVDDSGDFYEPTLILLDADNAVVASIEAWYEALLLVPLPADGEYTILASRFGGRTGTAEGGYTLTLGALVGLQPGEAVEGEMTADDTVLYAAPADAPFTLEVERISGDFSPEITVNVIGEYGDFEVIGTFYGETVRKMTLEIEPDLEQPVDFYLIQMARSSWDWDFEPKSVQYTLMLTR